MAGDARRDLSLGGAGTADADWTAGAVAREAAARRRIADAEEPGRRGGGRALEGRGLAWLFVRRVEELGFEVGDAPVLEPQV